MFFPPAIPTNIRSEKMPTNMTGKLSLRPTTSSLCSSCRHRLLRQQTRLASNRHQLTSQSELSIYSLRPSTKTPLQQAPSSNKSPKRPPLEATPPSAALPPPLPRPPPNALPAATRNPASPTSSPPPTPKPPPVPGSLTAPTEPYHLHVMATKHNTHITFSEPSRSPDPLLQLRLHRPAKSPARDFRCRVPVSDVHDAEDGDASVAGGREDN